MDMRVIEEPIRRSELVEFAGRQFGDMTKAVVDISKEIMVIGGNMHADEEAMLLDRGSRHEDLWGINLYSTAAPDDRVEFDSMINLRPHYGNRSRGVDDPGIREKILRIVEKLVLD